MRHLPEHVQGSSNVYGGEKANVGLQESFNTPAVVSADDAHHDACRKKSRRDALPEAIASSVLSIYMIRSGVIVQCSGCQNVPLSHAGDIADAISNSHLGVWAT